METLTEKIRRYKGGVVDNPYQGKDTKVLFVCSAGILRSATAARLYAGKYNTRACGSHTDIALIPITPRLMAWADEIVFVNQENFDTTENYLGKIEDAVLEKCVILNIPDQHAHMETGLIKEFKEQYADF